MTKLTELAAFVCGASVRSLPEADRAIQRRHFIDTVVAAVAGGRCRETTALDKLFGADTGDRMARLAAAIRMTEIDDIHMPSCTTPGSVVVPVAVVLAAEEPADAGNLADALWIGTEIMTRFGAAVRGPEILYREVWPTYLCAPLTAAATASRMLRLTEAETVNALSVALTLTAGGSGRFRQGLTPRWLLHGSGVRAGYLAAKAAAAGFIGDSALLDREWLKESHGVALDAERMVAGLGRAPSVYSELSLKPYSSAKQAIAAVEALRSIVAQGIDPAAIRSIMVRVPKAYAGMIGASADIKNRSTTFSSVRYQMALAVFHPDSLYDVARERLPLDERMRVFMTMVKVEPDESLATSYPARWPASVTIDAGGQPIERTLIDAPGDPGRRFDDRELFDKANRVLDPVVGREERDSWLDAAAACLDEPASHRPWIRMKRLVAAT
jgi:2-methylcitrate dehydratase PrpD